MKKNKAQLDKFVQVPNNVWHSRELSDGELRTYIAIRSHRNDNDRLGTFPSRERIKHCANKKDVSTITRHIKKLEKLGFIDIKYRFNDSTVYGFPSEGKKCKCSHICSKSTVKSDIYMSYCIKHIHDLKYKEDELTEYYEIIFGTLPTVDDLQSFIEDCVIANSMLEEE